MFKVIRQQILDSGDSIYGILSTVLFFTLFAGLFIYVYRMKKKKVEINKNLPFNDEN